jgi:hypothetical protein
VNARPFNGPNEAGDERQDKPWEGKAMRLAASTTRLGCAAALAALLAACAAPDERAPETLRLTADEGRARVARLLPDGVTDRSGWATDIYAAFAALDVAPSYDNLCAAIAIIGQESSFQVDPVIPNLPAIARGEIERQRERAGVPKLVLDAALALPSSTGKSYAERLETVKTELQLSEIYEDFIGRVPLGRTFLAERNPVHTAGPMQVNVAFAAAYAADRPYPYPVNGPLRHEVFTRRGGVYFGVAHLLDYHAPYDRMIYRFADFNAGRYASRNAAFQNAVTQLTGVPLVRDGDVLRYDNGQPAKEAGSTELAVRTLARRIGLDDAAIRRDLALGNDERFERAPVYVRVFEMADRAAGRALPRAIVPTIDLKSPKITRTLTTEWFAGRVDERYRRCLARPREVSRSSRPTP